ncbi:hypothetical protein D3C78_1788470 [compost metagenome]
MREHEAERRHQQIGNQRHRAGKVEHQREGVGGPIRADHEQLDDDVGQPQRGCRNAVLVFASEDPRHVFVL